MKNIMVCVPVAPNQGIVSGLVELLLSLKNSVGAIEMATTPDRKTSRNVLRVKFLQTNYEYMLAFDSDVIPPEKELVSMVENGIKDKRKFISGAVPGFNNNGFFWMAFSKKDKGFSYYEGLQEKKIYKVDATGLGCALIHRDLLEKIYFSDRYTKNGFIERTDDLDFCEQVQYSGHKIYLDYACQCEHFITKGLPLLQMWRSKGK